MIPTTHTLYDDFTYKGKFWLPTKDASEPQKIDGILRATAGKHIALELFGDFVPLADKDGSIGDGGEAGKPPLIHGQTDDGRTLTLFDSFYTNRHYGGACHVRSEYTSNLCIVGAWFDGDDDVQFHELELRLTHLEGWMDVDPFKGENLKNGEEVVGLTVTYTDPPTITVVIPDPQVTFKLVGGLESHTRRNLQVVLDHRLDVSLTSAAPLSLEATFKLMANVQQFFTLLVGEQVFLRKLRGWAKVRNANALTKSGQQKLHDAPCDVFFNQFDLREAKELMAHRMTVPYKALGTNFPQTLLNWFASLSKLGPVYNVFFATYRASRMFTETNFMHLSQSVESFDRQVNGGDIYLRDRIKRVLGSLMTEQRDLICVDVNKFTEAVVATRNNLTHVKGEPAPGATTKVLRDDQLHHASKKLEFLMVMLLLKHLGLASDLILQRVQNCQRFDLDPFTA